MLIEDNMKKESKGILILLIISCVLAIISPLSEINNSSLSKEDLFEIFAFYARFGLFFLYCWSYCFSYKLRVTKETLVLKTLFRKIEVTLDEITEYSFKRHGKSVFYNFKLHTDKRKIRLSTRYKDELIAILQHNGIEEIKS